MLPPMLSLPPALSPLDRMPMEPSCVMDTSCRSMALLLPPGMYAGPVGVGWRVG